MAGGKSSPFNFDGRSGATGNEGARPPLEAHLGPNPPQRVGSTRNPATVSAGGPAFKVDAPSDRSGQVGTTADPNQRRPFRLNATQGRAMPADDDAPAGSFPGDDDSDDPSNSDPTAGS